MLYILPRTQLQCLQHCTKLFFMFLLLCNKLSDKETMMTTVQVLRGLARGQVLLSLSSLKCDNVRIILAPI